MKWKKKKSALFEPVECIYTWWLAWNICSLSVLCTSLNTQTREVLVCLLLLLHIINTWGCEHPGYQPPTLFILPLSWFEQQEYGCKNMGARRKTENKSSNIRLRYCIKPFISLHLWKKNRDKIISWNIETTSAHTNSWMWNISVYPLKQKINLLMNALSYWIIIWQ